MRLYPTFSNRNFTARLSQPDIAFSVEGFSHQAIGGPESCTIKAAGSLTALWELVEILRCPVEVYDERGECVWWGFVNTVEIATGTYQYGVSLDSMANQIRVTYTPTGTSTRVDTDWTSNADSIAEYGTKEHQQSISDITAEQATNARDTALSQRKYPVPVAALASAEAATATITCRGWWDTLAWQYYRYVTPPNISLPKVHNVTTNFSWTSATTAVTYVSGYGSLVYDTVDTDLSTLLDARVNYQPYLRISIPSLGYDQYQNVWWLSGAAVGLPIQTCIALSFIVPNSAGTTGIYRTPTRLAIAFTNPAASAINVDWMRIWVGSVGTPSGNLILEVCADGAQPGAVLASSTLAGSTVGANAAVAARQLTLNTRVTIPAVARRWLVIRHSAAAATTNRFIVGCGVSNVNGLVDVGSGYRWSAIVPAFKVDDVWSTSEIFTNVITASGQFVTAVDILTAATLSMPQESNTDMSAQAVIRYILTSQTTARLLASVTRERRLVVSDEPVAASADYQLDSNGNVLDPYGNRVEPHRVVAGVWMRLRDVIPASADVSKLASADRFFAERVEYSGGRVTLYPRAVRDPFDFSTVEDG